MNFQKPQFNNPIGHFEKTVKHIHDGAGYRTKSVLKRYPITFSLLITFSLVSILHGFELVFDRIVFIKENPWILILVGLIILIATGTVYRALDNHQNFNK